MFSHSFLFCSLKSLRYHLLFYFLIFIFSSLTSFNFPPFDSFLNYFFSLFYLIMLCYFYFPSFLTIFPSLKISYWHAFLSFSSASIFFIFSTFFLPSSVIFIILCHFFQIPSSPSLSFTSLFIPSFLRFTFTFPISFLSLYPLFFQQSSSLQSFPYSLHLLFSFLLHRILSAFLFFPFLLPFTCLYI